MSRDNFAWIHIRDMSHRAKWNNLVTVLIALPPFSNVNNYDMSL